MVCVLYEVFMVVLLLVIFIGYIMSVVFLRVDIIKIMLIITVVVVAGDVAKPSKGALIWLPYPPFFTHPDAS